METHGDMGLFAENFDSNLLAKLREDGNESRSGSDNFEGASGDDQQEGGGDSGRAMQKKNHRHSQSQTQELESLFKECPHPDEKKRLALGRKLGLESRQIKFWFQNRRTQMKAQLERHENIILRQENEKLLAENILMKEAMKNPTCNTCGGLALVDSSVLLEDHQLKIENARLREELNRVCTLANKFLGRNLSSFANPLEIPNTSNGFQPGVASVGTSALPTGLGIDTSSARASYALSSRKPPLTLMDDEKSMLLNIAFNAMDEFMRLAQAAPPLWVKTLDGEKEVLNREEYLRSFNSCFGPTPAGYVTEATRDTGTIVFSSSALVEILTDANQWKEMFKGMIAVAATVDIVSDQISGSKNGAVQLMHTEMQLLSPLVPIRRSKFLRFSKQHAEGFWAVVDISLDSGNSFANCRRLPSGILVQDMAYGCSKVICIEHSEYDESAIHQLYKPLVSSGMAFGANRCIATLQRQCESFVMLVNPSTPSDDDEEPIDQAGKKSLWKLAQRMTDTFVSGICATGAHYWEKIPMGNLDDMRVMIRQNFADPGEPMGVVLSAATSVWMPVSRHKLFSFLKNEQLRSEWDFLAKDAPMDEVIHIAKGQAHENSISILRCTVEDDDSSTLILQESWTDASSSLLVYAPVDMHSLNAVLNGEESSYLALLPSGFAIYPDAQSIYCNGGYDEGGCLLTVGIQILINENPSSELMTDETAQTVNNIMTSLMQRIKAAVGA